MSVASPHAPYPRHLSMSLGHPMQMQPMNMGGMQNMNAMNGMNAMTMQQQQSQMMQQQSYGGPNMSPPPQQSPSQQHGSMMPMQAMQSQGGYPDLLPMQSMQSIDAGFQGYPAPYRMRSESIGVNNNGGLTSPQMSQQPPQMPQNNNYDYHFGSYGTPQTQPMSYNFSYSGSPAPNGIGYSTHTPYFPPDSYPLAVPAFASPGAYQIHATASSWSTAPKIRLYNPKERRDRIVLFLEKRSKRHVSKAKKVLYQVRKNFADLRTRVGGRFIKKTEDPKLENHYKSKHEIAMASA